MAPAKAIVASVIGVLALPAEAHQVGDMRRWLHDVLTIDHAAVRDETVLLTCELATNAIRHSQSVELTIVVLSLADVIRVEVTDEGGSGDVPRLVDSGPESTTGRGLRMVDLITGGRWGSYADATSRVVWFELTPEPRTPDLARCECGKKADQHEFRDGEQAVPLDDWRWETGSDGCRARLLGGGRIRPEASRPPFTSSGWPVPRY